MVAQEHEYGVVKAPARWWMAVAAFAWSLPWGPGTARYLLGGDYITREMVRTSAIALVAALVGAAGAAYLRRQVADTRMQDLDGEHRAQTERKVRAATSGFVAGSVVGEMVLALPLVGEALGSIGHGGPNMFLTEGLFPEMLLTQCVWGAMALGVAVFATSLGSWLVR